MVKTNADKHGEWASSRRTWHVCGMWTSILMLVGWSLVTDLPGAAQQRPRVIGPRESPPATGRVVVPPAARHNFVVGEKLVYNVRVTVPSLGLNATPVARFSTEVVERGMFYGREGLRLLVRAETTGFVKTVLFDLDDRFVTYLDAITRLPYRAEANIKEGERVERTVTVFDQAGRTAQINGVRSVKLSDDTYDFAGLLWTTRNLDFEGPPKVRLSALNERNGTVVTVEIERLGCETIEVAGQAVSTVQLALRPLDARGKPSDERKIRLWITDDADRYAVRITGGNDAGEFKAELARFPSRSDAPEALPPGR
ncbi:MAG: DUF3108 domain-containing protein [Acidobacteriota bacterium]